MLSLLVAAIALSGAGVPVGPPVPQGDSIQLLREARDAQARFVRLQVRSAPMAGTWSSARCDESFGRLCLRFSSEDPDPDPWAIDWSPPPEPEEVTEARLELVARLAEIAAQIPGDAWVSGQWVVQAGEAGRWNEAIEAAHACRSPRPGWCHALQGYALHGSGEPVAALERFEAALGAMAPEDRARWLDPEWIVDADVADALRSARGEEREALAARIWRRSDPWFSTAWNELKLEHFARWTYAEAREQSWSAHGMRWGEDLTQYVVRFGPEAGFRRIRDESIRVRMEPPRVSGHLYPGMRHLVPSADALLTRSDDDRWTEAVRLDQSEFTTDRRVGRSIHHAGSRSRIRGFPAQIARFSRGDSVLVAVAWEYPVPPSGHPYWEEVATGSLPHPLPEDPDPSVLIQPWDPPPEWDGRAEPARIVTMGARPSPTGEPRVAGGHLLGLVAPGTHLLSIEVPEPNLSRGWRHRTAMHLLARGEGGLALSDILLVKGEEDAVAVTPQGAPPQEDFGTAVPTARDLFVDEAPATPDPLRALVQRAIPTNRVPRGAVDIVWEVYGLEADARHLTFALQVEPLERGVLRRIGEALRVVDRRRSFRLRWEEGVSEREAGGPPLLRHLSLDLSELDTGEHRLRLELEGQGEVVAVAILDLVITGAGD